MEAVGCEPWVVGVVAAMKAVIREKWAVTAVNR